MDNVLYCYELRNNLFDMKLFAFSLPQIIKRAADQDKEGVLIKSREMKFLTGYESKVMNKHYTFL